MSLGRCSVEIGHGDYKALDCGLAKLTTILMFTI